jgi:tRNA1Val (adenine37-N6)-methyltransferase
MRSSNPKGMGNNYFRFKQFTIVQNNAAMRVNTDGVLLGAWADVAEAKRILDVGTGTGVIALMLAQRKTDALIDAVEIDVQSAADARQNIANSPWPDRVDVINTSFQTFAETVSKSYDLIVSNPPYFNQSLKSPKQAKNISRHTDSLPNEDLLKGISKLLLPQGKFCGVFPYAEGNVFIAQASSFGLYCNKKVNVVSRPGKRVLRLLLQFEKTKMPLVESTLSIHNADGSFTDAYKELTSDFYLKF